MKICMKCNARNATRATDAASAGIRACDRRTLSEKANRSVQTIHAIKSPATSPNISAATHAGHNTTSSGIFARDPHALHAKGSQSADVPRQGPLSGEFDLRRWWNASICSPLDAVKVNLDV